MAEALPDALLPVNEYASRRCPMYQKRDLFRARASIRNALQ
jgi:hypothetical protein